MAFENIRYHCIVSLYFIHKCVVSLAISSGNFNFPDVSSISLFADKSCVNFGKQILFDTWTSAHKKVTQMVANRVKASLILINRNFTEFTHHLKVVLVCDNLQGSHWALFAPRLAQRWNIFFVVHQFSQQELVVRFDCSNHIASVAFQTTFVDCCFGIIQLLNLFVNYLGRWVPLA